MPKDDSSPQDANGGGNGSGDGQSKAPLKRGDACLYCRKRRIRCSAHKPTCDHCKKLKRECVYDIGKPVSRVKQLEDKVAELESLLTRAAGGDGGPTFNNGKDNGNEDNDVPIPGSGSGSTFQQPQISSFNGIPNSSRGSFNGGPTYLGNGTTQYTTPANQDNFTLNMNTLGGGGSPLFGPMDMNSNKSSSLPAFGGSMMNTQPVQTISSQSGSNAYGGFQAPRQQQQQQQQRQNPEDLFDFSTLDPNFMNLVNQFSNTTTSSSNDNGQNANNTVSMSGVGGVGGGSGGVDQSNLEALDTPALINMLTNSNNTDSGYFVNSNSNTSTIPTFPPSQSAGPQSTQSRSSSSSNPTPSIYHPYVTSIPESTPASSYSRPQTSSSGPSVSSYPSTAQSIQAPSSQDTRINNPYSSINGVDMSGYVGSLDPQRVKLGVTNPLPSTSNSQSTSQSNNGTSWLHGDIKSNSSSSSIGGKNSQPGAWDNVFGDPELHKMPLVGGWFDAADLPTIARDHLLDIFFDNSKMIGLQFHIPRFMTSLGLPPSKRPHPCLLYSMYTLASRTSTSPAIRALESHFYGIAMKQLDEAVSRADRILDAVRAATLLSVYKYSLARYHEGYMMGGMACRLAVSAGLHQISSNVWKAQKYPMDQRADLGNLMRQRAYVVEHPRDPIDLGERIWAFWAIYTVDRCGSISSQWPSAIPDEIITTPFPKLLHEYELGLVSTKDDVSLSSVWLPPNHNFFPTLNPYAEISTFILRLRALSILERASKLIYLPPEVGWENKLRSSSLGSSPSASGPSPPTQYFNPGLGGGSGPIGTGSSPWSPNQAIDEFLRSQNWQALINEDSLMDGNKTPSAGNNWFGNSSDPFNPGNLPNNNNTYGNSIAIGVNSGDTRRSSTEPTPSKGWTRCARIRNPKAYEEVRDALLRIESDLPVERRTNWEVWDGKVQDWHFEAKPNGRIVILHFCIGCAWMFLWDVYSFQAENRLAVGVARRMTFTIGVCLTNAYLGNEMDVFIAMVFSFIVKILIRESKRLHSTGDHAGAAPIESEIETIVQALQMFGKRYNIASMQALRADRYRKSTAQETAFMENDDLDETNPLDSRAGGAGNPP